MRKGLIIGLVMGAIIVTSCQKKDRFIIRGSFSNLPDSTKIELIPGATLKEENPIAEAFISKGSFTFEGSVPEPRLFYIKIDDGGGVLDIMVENGCKVNVVGQPIRKTESTSVYYEFNSIKVTGSPINDEYKAKVAFKKELDSMYAANYKLGEKIYGKMNAAYSQNNKVLMDSIKSSKGYLEVMEREKAFFKKVEDVYKNAVMSNKDIWWGPFMMLNTYSYFEEEQREWYNQFPEAIKTSYYGQIVMKNLPRESWVGKVVPDFTVIKDDGSKANLKDLVAAKKYYLLDFWASWCEPCKKEIPNFKNLYKKYASKGFEIVSISIDKDAIAWKDAVKEHELTWLNFRDVDHSIADLYEVKLIPAIFLIDGSGKIVLDNKRGEELANKLAELLK